MKKFYYKKSVSLDKTPIILRLERRDIMNVNKEGTEEQQIRIATRTTSVGNVDHLKDTSAVPKVKTREVAKSLSEGVLCKDHLKNAARVITESDLSSSSLYKTRKASINSKESQQQIPQQADLSPVVLQDPKLKPVPVGSHARSKKTQSSCLCYFAIMVAISFCTMGLLAVITGILYKEIFVNANTTSHEMTESLVDITNLSQEPQSQDNDSTTNGFHINNETIQKSFENTGNVSNKSGNKASNLSEDQSEKSSHEVDFDKLDFADLSHFLDSRKAEIKFRDGDTVIYEMNSSTSLEYEKNTTVLNVMNTPALVSNGNKTEANSSEVIEGWTGEEVIKEFKKVENLETLLNSQSEEVKNLSLIDNKQELQQSINTVNGQLKEGTMKSRLDELKFDAFGASIKHNESETLDSEEFQSSRSNSEIDVSHVDDKTAALTSVLKDNDRENSNSSNPKELLSDEQELQTEVRNSLPFETNMKQQNNDHDVESMVMVVNEPIEESLDANIFNRNGDISPFTETLYSKPTGSLDTVIIKSESMNPIKQATTELQQLKVSKEHAVRMKPLDVKGSLVEAMKHLQVLDVNNKLLTSRIQSIKPKTQDTKQTKLNKPRNKESITMEKMQYLQNLRLALQENLQRF